MRGAQQQLQPQPPQASKMEPMSDGNEGLVRALKYVLALVRWDRQ